MRFYYILYVGGRGYGNLHFCHQPLDNYLFDFVTGSSEYVVLKIRRTIS